MESMNMTIEYTLEKHLENLCLSDPNYKILNSIWGLNKEKLKEGLSLVIKYFPHFSRHDSTHSKVIIKNIESLLGEERIKKLSPTETFLILMSCYMHDIGMVLLHDVVIKEWCDSDFMHYLQDTSQDMYDQDSAKAAILLLDMKKNFSSGSYDESFEWALDVKNAVIKLTASYFRGGHHERSQNYIKEDSSFKKLADNFYSEQLPSRFLDLLADIAYGHGVDFYTIFNMFEYQANGIKSDKIHPRFIACLVRLGDLLDVDDKRFNEFSIHSIDIMPEISKVHKEKHASIKHLLITPDSIEITCNCQNENVYREARSWFDWLILEVQNQSKEWVSIAPKNLGGLPPVILDNKIKVLYQGKELNKDFASLKFNISSQKVFSMLEGGALYEDAELVFLREIVQNAIDASKIQLWKDVLNGNYDYILLKHLISLYPDKFKDKKEIEYSKDIQFPDDIPDTIYNCYPIDLSVKWDDKDKQLIIVCEDFGTGISHSDLIRMTNKVGESRSLDKNYLQLKKGLPFWLKPTGAFGIGLQSIFLGTPLFTIFTKASNEEGKRITFRSGRKSSYCWCENYSEKLKRGTKIEIMIKESVFSKIFKDSFSLDIADKYDYFTDRKGSIYLYKMQEYLLRELKKIKNLRIDFLDEGFIKKIETLEKNEDSENSLTGIGTYVHDKYKINSYTYPKYNELPFNVFENIVVGSEIYISFLNSFNNLEKDYYYTNPSIGDFYCVRNIPIKNTRSSFFRTIYCGIIWNLLSPESDKILSLSRNRMIPRQEKELSYKLLYDILPNILPSIKRLFEEKYEEYSIDETSKKNIYFNILLSCFINDDKPDPNREILDNLIIPKFLISKIDNKELSAIDFFNLKRVLVFNFENHNWGFNKKKTTIENSMKELNKKSFDLKVDAVIKRNDYFEQYLKNRYQIDQLIKLNGSSAITLKLKEKDFSAIVMDDESRGEYLRTIIHKTVYLDNRLRLYVIDKYSNLGVKNFRTSFEYPPYLANHSIVSPFNGKKDIDLLKKELFAVDKDIKLEEYIKANIVNKFVNDKMINFLIKESSLDNAPTKEDILSSYSMFLAEVYKIMEEVDLESISSRPRFKF